MTVFRFQPFGLTPRFATRQLATHPSAATWQPAVDVREEKDRYVVRADLPGVDTKDIAITAEDGVLTVKGVRQDGANDDRGVYNRQELPQGAFERSFRLPKHIDAERIAAHGKNGVLEIVIPKAEQNVARTIKVNG